MVSSQDVPGNGTDAWHFSAAGYRIFGKRYATEALKVMGREVRKNADYTLPDNLKNFFTPKSFDTRIAGKANSTVVLKLWCTYNDGHRENLTSEATFTSTDFTIANGRVKLGEEGTSGTVTATVTDFNGTEHQIVITIEASGSDGLGIKYASIDELTGKSFAIVNEEESMALYGSKDQNLAYDVYEKAFIDTNSGYKFKLVSLSNNADASIRNYHLIRLIQPSGTEYSIWGSPGYLNSQPADGWCSFILGLNNQNGQDIKNGAVWEVQYEAGKGFTLKNIATGLYLHDAAPAKYDAPAYFTFCSLDGTSGIETTSYHANANENVYNLQGMKVASKANWSKLPQGLYIINGKKTIKK